MDQHSNNHSENPFQPLIGLANRVANRVNRMAGLSSGHTQSLVERLTHQGEHNQVWVPNLGSLSPHMVERFSSAIVQRFPNITSKYLIETPNEKTGDQQEIDDLVLSPGGLAGPALWQPEPDSQAQPARTEQPAPPNLPGSDTQPPPSMLIRASEPVQRKSNVRPISRTEEMKPGANPVPERSLPFSGKTDPSIGQSPSVKNAVQRSGETPITPDIDRRSMPVDRAEPTQSRPEGAIQRVSSSTTLPSARIAPADRPVPDAQEHIPEDLPVHPDRHTGESSSQRSEPVSKFSDLPGLAPPVLLQTQDDPDLLVRTQIEQHTGMEPGEPKSDTSQPPSREPTMQEASTPFEQSVDEVLPPVKAQPQAARLQRKISEEQSTPPEVGNISSEPVTGQAPLPLAPLAQPQAQENSANIPEPHIGAESDQTLVRRSVVQNSKGEEAQTFEPIKKASPPPSQNIPPARSIESVLPLASPLAAAEPPVQKSPAGADERNRPEPSQQAVESAGEPLFQPGPQHQNLPNSGKPAADPEPDKASEPVTDMEPAKTSEPVMDSGSYHQADSERVPHAEPSIQRLPLAGRPPATKPEPPVRTPVQDSLPAVQLEPAELTPPPAVEGMTQPDTRIRKFPLAGEPSLSLDAPLQTSAGDIQPVTHLETPKPISPPAVDGVVQHELPVQKRPLLDEQVKHPEPPSPLTLAPAGKPVTHLDSPDQALSPVSTSKKSEPQSELPAHLEPMNSEPKLVDTRLEKTEIAAGLPESHVILRKPVDPANADPGMPAETVRSIDKTSSEAKISPTAYIRKESDAVVQHFPLAPLDLGLPTRIADRDEKPVALDVVNPPAEKPDVPGVVNPPPSKNSDQARMEGIQREVELSHPRQPEKQDLSQPTTVESSQPMVQRKTAAEPAALKPATRELPETLPAPIELFEPQNPEPQEIPDIAEVDETPKLARSIPVQETSVNPLIPRRLVKDASREPVQSDDSVSPESRPELPLFRPASRQHDEPSRAAEPIGVEKTPPSLPAPGLDHTLLARAAARVTLPLTAPRVEIRRQAKSSQPIPSSVSSEHQESKAGSLFAPIQSPAVLPQARFDAILYSDEDNLEPAEDTSGRVQLTPSNPYHRAERKIPFVQKLPLVQRVSEPVMAEDQPSNHGSASSQENFSAAPPPVEQIQRMLANGAFNQPVVQRVEADQPAADRETPVNEEDEELDLDQIARDVYPIIKRLLAIERERYKGR